MLEQGKYSDLTIKCGRKKYAVHRAIICSRSGFFDGAVSHPFRESISGEIDLSEDDEEAVEHMVNYFYHLDYLQTRRSRRSSRSSSIASPYPNSPYPTSPIARRTKKLNLALVEDPLLAVAASHTINTPTPFVPISQPQNITSPIDSLPSSPLALKIPPQSPIRESFADDVSVYSAPEQEPDIERPYLLTHTKVYALAEK